MTGQHLLLVDDEPQLVRALTPALVAAGYHVHSVETGAAAISHLAQESCDVLLLDLGLPDMDGKAVIASVREWSEVPIVVLSARDMEDEKIEALDLGADDFVNKPFSIGELLARVRAAQRGRDRRLLGLASHTVGDIEINFASRRVFVMDDEVRLTPREFDLLRCLARHAGRVVTHKQIIAALWGAGGGGDAQSVRVLVGQVRQKIEEDSSVPLYLQTETGIGYRLAGDEGK